MRFSGFSDIVIRNPKSWERRKKKFKKFLPIPNSAVKYASRAASRLHQKYIEDFVFIHINKTGGTALERALGIPLTNHDIAVERREVLGSKEWEKRFKFAVVRNPYERFASTFAYLHRDSPFPSEEAPERFVVWLERVYEKYRDGRHDRNEGPQLAWVVDEAGRIILDKICRYETLETDLADVAKVLGRPIELQRINKTRISLDYEAIYLPRSRSIVNEMHSLDFEAFGYRKTI